MKMTLIQHFSPLQMQILKKPRSNRPEKFCKKGVLRNFAKFTGKHVCQSLFFNKETLAKVFSREFCEISKNTFFLQNTSGGGFLKKDKRLLYNKDTPAATI